MRTKAQKTYSYFCTVNRENQTCINVSTQSEMNANCLLRNP